MNIIQTDKKSVPASIKTQLYKGLKKVKILPKIEAKKCLKAFAS